MFDDAPWILERAFDYWQDGRVESVERIAPSLFHARVAGNETGFYDVDVRVDDSGCVMSSACTCPYHATPYCKHVGAVLYELRLRLSDDHEPDATDNTDTNDTRRRTHVPSYVLDGVLKRIEQEKRDADGSNILFFWSNRCIEYANHLTREGTSETLIPTREAGRMMLGPMDAYHRRHGIHHHDDAIPFEHDGMPYPDDPTLDEALAGFHTVVDNALHSTDWENACLNLAVAAEALAAFTNSVEDERHELSNENDLLSSEIRCYMENVARYADSATASIALGEIAKAAYTPDIQFYDPVNAAMLLASAAAFARHDDKTMWSYDVVDTALERFSERHDADLPHEALLPSRHVLRRYMLMVAYDVRRLAGDDEGCDTLRREHPDHAPLALMRVVTLLDARQYREARDAAETFLATVTDRDQADAYIMRNGLVPGLLPHGWRTILECCAEGMDDAARLTDLYRGYIVAGNDKGDVAYVNRLRRLLRAGDATDMDDSTSTDDTTDARWHDEARRLARRCARNVAERITSQPEMTTVDDGIRTIRRSSWRNPAYEKLIVDERLTDDALTYCVTIAYPPLPLLKTMAIGHPDKARETILETLPQSALSEDDIAQIARTGEVPAGTPNRAANRMDDRKARGIGNRRAVSGARRMSATRGTYRQILKQLRRYAAVFGETEARRIAGLIADRYPNRPALHEELRPFLD